MVKLTADLIQHSPQYVNPCKDRELNLRGHKIAVIENLGATHDQFNCIDFSNNDIRKVGSFPVLNRLTVLLFNENPIVKIADGLDKYIPNLEVLVLTSTAINNCYAVDPLACLKNLRVLTLLNAPVTKLSYYRLYVVYKIPQVKVLDFRKVKLAERRAAKRFFTSEEGEAILSRKKVQIVDGKPFGQTAEEKSAAQRADEIRRIRRAMSGGSTMDEVEKLKRLLMCGKLLAPDEDDEDEDEDEDEEEEEKIAPKKEVKEQERKGDGKGDYRNTHRGPHPYRRQQHHQHPMHMEHSHEQEDPDEYEMNPYYQQLTADYGDDEYNSRQYHSAGYGMEEGYDNQGQYYGGDGGNYYREVDFSKDSYEGDGYYALEHSQHIQQQADEEDAYRKTGVYERKLIDRGEEEEDENYHRTDHPGGRNDMEAENRSHG